MTQRDTHGHPPAMVCVAAPEDAALLDHWERHLRPLEQAGLLSVWSELHLAAGKSREQEQEHHLNQANLILLLLSADFFASPHCLTMMERALERSKESKARVIPLLLRPVTWQESALGRLTPWPSNGKPIMLWSDPDEGWHACVQELRRLLGRRISEELASERLQKHTDPDWERMLRRLDHSYKELLDQSLHGTAWVELGLSARPDAVSNVTTLLFRLPQGDERLLPPSTRILDAYTQAQEELLILGAPGAGKSTLLLDLAQQLVSRARADPTHPLPVIVRLSSWAVGQPSLANWMIEQLSRTYAIPRQLSERWVHQGRVLPLLDGLDETEEAARPACIAAINTYHQTYLTPLVVCSRQAEYEVAATRERLVLQSAVIVQPLSQAQMGAILNDTGPTFAGVRSAWEQEPALRALTTTPLMLSVLLLTYRGVAASEIVQRGAELEQQVWTDYIARQVAEKGNPIRYPLERTRATLSWLAQKMSVHQQTIFYAEYLQPDWLALDQQRSAICLATRLPAMIIGGCIGLLVFLLVLGQTDYAILLQIGLLSGFIGNSFSQQVTTGQICVTRRLSHERWTSVRKALLLGVLLAASQGLYLHPPQPSLYDLGYSFIDWGRDGCLFGLGGGLSFWIFQRLLHRMDGKLGRKTRARPSWQRGLAAWFTRMASPSVWQAATVLGVGMGLSAGLSDGLGVGLSDELGHGLGVGLSVGLGHGLSVGIIVVLVHAILAHSMRSLRFAERVHWSWRDLFNPEHLRTSLIVAGTLFLFFGLSAGLSGGLGQGLSFWLSTGLSAGLSAGLGQELSFWLGHGLSAGLGFGLSAGLIFWLLLGLYQGMKQEHLEDQDRQRFNQGIRRSLHNGLLLGLISAIIISTIGGLRYELSYVLDVELNVGLDIVWTLLFASLIVMWALSGGLTILRHYVIRWQLARHRTFPWRAQAFLDDATARILMKRVGGGYAFIHRRLQDYFADTVAPPPQA